MRCPFCKDDVPKGRPACGNCGAALEELVELELQVQSEHVEKPINPEVPPQDIVIEPNQGPFVDEQVPPAEIVEEPDLSDQELLPEDEGPILPSDGRAIRQMDQVPPGELVFIELGVLAPGAHIEGRLIEADGDIFDYFIVDEEGYNALMSGDEAQTLDEGSDATNYHVELDIGQGSIHYLVLENRSQSAPVDIKVELRMINT
jgi:hypothetical protein